ncbi:WD domain, G-beta repeat domain containing protein [Cardiosporidium cionae]|uniref:Pre-mRNA-processing factor 19 n=1 Tax=Cardiosporidium cionae TaxID=476202 RepID=A0ABQ7JF09_9APIC|nr:WD domain, G-beta repeat domain containing protein [Cardiosporidium cionae]|eukprot:KAF8822480.1 WD domain, G-beta repeat domain containing protein [Cardiosporidium cionae]
MSLVCAISGSLPEEPVLSKTGYIFERRLIEKHIDANGKCPVTGVDLDKVDLHPINVPKTVKPRPLTAASIPGLLSLFQGEWDSIMAETFQLRTQLETVRNQLSHSLYQHDAATRVIARLLRERDATNQQINELQKQLSTAKTTESGEGEIGISETLMNEMLELAQTLLASRRKRQIQALTTVDQIKSYKVSANYPLHSSVSPGVLCLDIDPKTGNQMVTGGSHFVCTILVVSCVFFLTLCKLQGHLKRINCVKIHPKESIVLSGSDDKTVRIWKGDDDSSQYKCAHTLRKHRGEVKSLAIHPLNDYFVSSGKDKSWIFSDMNSGKCLLAYKDLACNFILDILQCLEE